MFFLCPFFIQAYRLIISIRHHNLPPSFLLCVAHRPIRHNSCNIHLKTKVNFFYYQFCTHKNIGLFISTFFLLLLSISFFYYKILTLLRSSYTLVVLIVVFQVSAFERRILDIGSPQYSIRLDIDHQRYTPFPILLRLRLKPISFRLSYFVFPQPNFVLP